MDKFVTVENYPPHLPQTASYLQEWLVEYGNEGITLDSLRLVYLDDMSDADFLLAQNAANALTYLKNKHFKHEI